jgi:hypothetical protein
LKKESLIPKLAAVILDLTLVGNVTCHAETKKRCDDQGNHEDMNQEKGHHVTCPVKQEA